jgi:hypothetical protein
MSAQQEDRVEFAPSLYAEVWCSQCGRGFGPGDHGFSHCHQHAGHARDLKLIADRLKDEADAIRSLAQEIDRRCTDPLELYFAIRNHVRALRGVLATIGEMRGRK